MTEPDLYDEWVPYALNVRRGTPRGGTFEVLDAYAAHLRGLDLLDPTTPKASALRVAAEHVRDAAGVAESTEAADVAAAVAKGTITPTKALDELARRPDSGELRKAAQRRQQDAQALIADLLHRAVLAIHDYGEGWLKVVLKPIAAEAVKTGNEQRWLRAHTFAAWLRDPKWAAICALAAAMPNQTDDADMYVYMFADQRAVQIWRLDNSTFKQRASGPMLLTPSGGRIMASTLAPTAPFPTFADICANAHAWRPWLYSADEVVENMHRALAEQDREIAALMQGAVPDKKPRVVVI